MNVQTSVMVKKPNEAHPSSLEWMWRSEMTHDTIVRGKGQVVAQQIVDQKEMANDTSDYLWYMTRCVYFYLLAKSIISHNFSMRNYSLNYFKQCKTWE